MYSYSSPVRRRLQRTIADNGGLVTSQPTRINDGLGRDPGTTQTNPPVRRDPEMNTGLNSGIKKPWWQTHTLHDQPLQSPWRNKINKYLLTDEQYQKDRADLLQNFRNMRLANLENRGNLKIDKRTTLQRLTKEQADNFKAMQADFAARGMYGGAGYQDKLGDFNLDYLNQRSDANESYQRNLGQLLRDLGSARTLEEQNMQQARLEAIRRRAAELGIIG